MADSDKYNFEAEYVEEHSGVVKEYLLTVYIKRTGGPTELSLFDVKAHKVFLKKGVYDQDGPVQLRDLYVNGVLTVCARKFRIRAYADSATKTLFEKNCEQVFTLIGSAAYRDLGSLFSAAESAGLTLKRVKSVHQASATHPAIAVELIGPNVAETWAKVVEEVCGPRASSVSCEPSSFFTEKVFLSPETTAKLDETSALCIVRPHALREGKVGAVISGILSAGLGISAMQSFALLKSQAETFYEVYKTVVPSAQYVGMISELSSGICLAIEVYAAESAVPLLRELSGPFDVEIARHLRPKTLRALYGRDNVHNVVHCTDLPEDGVLECQYFFTILSGAS